MDFITSVDDNRVSSGNVCLLFTAEWCGPCKMLKPALEAYETDKFKIYLVDVDATETWGLSAQYNVRSVPTGVTLIAGDVVNIRHGVEQLQPAEIAKDF